MTQDKGPASLPPDMTMAEAKDALRKAETALEAAVEKERRVADEHRRKIAEIAHDIKNPLTAMIAYSKVMQGSDKIVLKPDDYQKYSGVLHKTSLRLLDLCETLLADTGPDAKAAEKEAAKDIERPDPTKPQRVHAADMIQEMATLYEQMASQRGIHLGIDIEDEFPDLETVPLHLSRALNNLMSNAIKFTPKGGNINIGAKINKDDEAVIFVIRDTGQGIPADQIMKILNPYQTTQSPHLDKGTGLGLPIVRKLVSSLGGNMSISSQPREGTTVTLRFPKNIQLPSA